MLRRAFALSVLLAMFSAPAMAAEEKKEEKGDVGQYVDLQAVALPIVVDRRLVNYVFVHIRINLTSKANVAALREKEPFFRDALVRASHRTPFTVAGDLGVVDVPKLTASLSREAAVIAGPGMIRSVVVESQAPRRRVRMIRPAA